MGIIEQGEFYLIKYLKTQRTDYLESKKQLYKNKIYTLTNGKQFKVIRKAKFKYTIEDIDNIRVMMEDYDIGTVQHNLCMRMARAFKEKVPAVRFSDKEREILSYVYYENEYITDKDRATLRKVLNIK